MVANDTHTHLFGPKFLKTTRSRPSTSLKVPTRVGAHQWRERVNGGSIVKSFGHNTLLFYFKNYNTLVATERKKKYKHNGELVTGVR